MKDENNISQRALRDALGCFATGVGVITSITRDGHQIGLTINSFSSLSLEPPLILWSLSLDSGLVGHFREGTGFAVNFLAESQKALAKKFATAQEDRFKNIAYKKGLSGAPVFVENAGIIECRTEAVFPGGDHIIIVGRIEAFDPGKSPPLIFHRGCFSRLERKKP